MQGERCQYCDGTVRAQRVDREAFRHRDGFVILEDVTIGVCDHCGNRYYSADVLHAVHQLATGKRRPERTASVPVGHID